MRLEGGAPRAMPGQTSTATQVLRPGKYYAFHIETNSSASFEVKGGDGGGSLPDAPGGTVAASEYKFEASDLKTGRQQILFEERR